MQAAQRVLGFVVIELRHRADGLPSHRGMAVLTRDIQIAMGTSRNSRLGAGRRR
jgi:hypothetical protein